MQQVFIDTPRRRRCRLSSLISSRTRAWRPLSSLGRALRWWTRGRGRAGESMSCHTRGAYGRDRDHGSNPDRRTGTTNADNRPRYRYHAPKYYRGPLHPVQPLPSSDPTARDFSPGPFNLPRLKQTYQSTIASDIMTMMYQHTPPGTPDKPERIRLREWDESSPYMKNRPKRGPRGSGVLFPLEKSIDWRNIPEIHAVHLAMYIPEAKRNFDHIIIGRAVLRAITGVRSTQTANKTSVVQWGIVKGDRSGVKCSIFGNQAYEFIDKTVHLVFPKIKEWRGVRGQ